MAEDEAEIMRLETLDMELNSSGHRLVDDGSAVFNGSLKANQSQSLSKDKETAGHRKPTRR